MVTSPYLPEEDKYIDVPDFASGSVVKDPYTGKFFLVPVKLGNGARRDARHRNTSRSGIARVDGNAVRVAGASTRPVRVIKVKRRGRSE